MNPIIVTIPGTALMSFESQEKSVAYVKQKLIEAGIPLCPTTDPLHFRPTNGTLAVRRSALQDAVVYTWTPDS